MPALSDGRMTVYLSRCEMNADIQRRYGITGEAQYRSFLQTNGAEVDAYMRYYSDVLPYYHVTPCVSSVTPAAPTAGSAQLPMSPRPLSMSQTRAR